MTEHQPCLVNICIEQAYRKRLDEVADRLAEAGLKVEAKLAALGVISGTIAEDKMQSLQEVEGVQSVEKSRRVELMGDEPTPESTPEQTPEQAPE